MKEKQESPPKLAKWLLERIYPIQGQFNAKDDFAEVYNMILKETGFYRANCWYWWQVLKSIPAFIKNQFYWRRVMFGNYVKVALRNIKRQKTHSVINIAGLSIAMAVCILLLLFVRYELSFDKYHEKKDRIYRILWEIESDGEPFTMALTPLPLTPALKSDFPEVTHSTRISRQGNRLLTVGDKKFYENMIYADADLFDIFSFPLLKGDPKTALVEPYSIVINRKLANKYFGNDNPIGKTVTIGNSQDYKVTGILQEIQDNSHFQFELFASFSSLNNTDRVKGKYWDRIGGDYTYVLLSGDCNLQALENKISTFIKKYMPEADSPSYLYFQPLLEIYFSNIHYDGARNGDKNYLYAYSAIVFFILLIACINFMNLATARSSGRAKEVGLRKVIGANRKQLIGQFLSESVFLAILALAVAVGLVYLILPEFNLLIGRKLVFNVLNDPLLYGGFLVLNLLIGLLSGSYPALYLSGFQPVKVLQGMIKNKGFSFRRFFVVSQFAISIILIFATMVVYNQLNFMSKKDRGFVGEKVVVIPLRDRSLRENYKLYKNQVKQNPAVRFVSASNGAPATGSRSTRPFAPEGWKEGETKDMLVVFADFDFLETFGLELIEGRNFSREFSTDATQAYILNETAVREIGWDNPIGKRFFLEDNREGWVIGVVKDFHLDSVHDKISPMVFEYEPDWFFMLSIKLQTADINSALTFLEEKWNEFAPNYPFEYSFIDKEFEQYYYFERKLGKIFTYCSFLAIFISCLGIFGMASFTTEKRTKEMGIRKVLGASVAGIATLLSKEFIKWVLLANSIAWPIGYYVMKKWLQGFAYQTTIPIWTFLFSAILALGVALLTVSYQAVKAAVADPVNALKYE